MLLLALALFFPKNPIFCTYNLQSLHGHSIGFHIYIITFKETLISVYFIYIKSDRNSAEHATFCTLRLSVDDKNHIRVSGWKKLER